MFLIDFASIQIPRTCSPKIVSAEFVRACAASQTFVDESEFILSAENALAISTESGDPLSADWLRIDSLEEAAAAEQAEIHEKASQEALELAARRKEEKRLMALQPPAVKRIVMGRDGKIKYIYKDNKQVIVQPTNEDHLLSQIDIKARLQRESIDVAAADAKSAKRNEKKRQKKAKQKAAKRAEAAEGLADNPTVSLAWSFGVFPSSKAGNSILGIDMDYSSSGGLGPFRIRNSALKSVAKASCGPSHSAIISGTARLAFVSIFKSFLMLFISNWRMLCLWEGLSFSPRPWREW